MPLIPLSGGAYQARSPIANAQRCVNLYPEKNRQDAEAPTTHYQTPGMRPLVADGLNGAWRGLYLASNEKLYGVRGGNVYYISSDWTLTLLGTIPSGSTPVCFSDNSIDILLVDGSSSGWSINLSTDAFAVVSDPNFTGGDFVGYMNGFFVLNRPGTQEWYSSEIFSLTFNALDFARKIGGSDKLMGIVVNHLEVWLLGRKTGEVWAANDGAGFPFIRVPGVFIEHGCVAKYSIARYDVNVFWLSQDNNGEALVLQGMNYQSKIVSTPALTFAISKYETITDAIGFVYQQGNHVFYVLIFPTANKTWVYDMSEQEWHERVSTDLNGRENRIRANCTAFAYGKNIVGDYQNGKLYEWSEAVFTDDGAPIVRRRGFPHVTNQGKVNFHSQFAADISTGTIVAPKGNPTRPPRSLDPAAAAYTPVVSLRWSDDRGFSWGNPVAVSLGASGEYSLFVTWQNLGMARDRVYELFWSEDCDVALNGAYLDVTPLQV